MFLGRLRGRRPDHRDHRGGVGLAGDADEVAYGRGGGEDHRIELARLDGVTGGRRGRGGPHGPVGGDIVALPAELDQAGDQRLGGDVGSGQEDPVDRVQLLVELWPHAQQTGGGLLLGGDQVRAEPPAQQRLGGLVADGGYLEPGERAGVQAVVVELLPHRPDGVDGGERDPLVAAFDQAADGLVHLLRVPRRLHRDGRHLLWDGAEPAQGTRQRGSLLLGARHQHPPAEQRPGLKPGESFAQVDDLTDHDDRRRSHPGRASVCGDVRQGRDHGDLFGGRADPGHRDRSLGRATGVNERLGDVGDLAHRGQQDQGAVVGVLAPVDAFAAGDHRHLGMVLGGQRYAGEAWHRGDR